MRRPRFKPVLSNYVRTPTGDFSELMGGNWAVMALFVIIAGAVAIKVLD